MVARWLGLIFTGGANYAGYAMATTSFLALAYTFNHNAHIRVSLFVTRAGRWRRAMEIWCYTLGSLAACFLAWYAIKATLLSHRINDISQGQDATPLWIPQTFMAIGAVIFAIAVVDNLCRIVFAEHQGVDGKTDPLEWLENRVGSHRARLLMLGGVLLIVWAAAVLMTGFDRDAVRDDWIYNAGSRQCHDHYRVDRGQQLDVDCVAAVHLDGRNPLSHALV